jgi:hypothetical protein
VREGGGRGGERERDGEGGEGGGGGREVETWDSKTPHVGFNAFFLTVEILLFASALGGTLKSI